MTEAVTCVCGKRYRNANAKGWDTKRRRCADLSACVSRATAGLPTTGTSPWINQQRLYESAPKIGDA